MTSERITALNGSQSADQAALLNFGVFPEVKVGAVRDMAGSQDDPGMLVNDPHFSGTADDYVIGLAFAVGISVQTGARRFRGIRRILLRSWR